MNRIQTAYRKLNGHFPTQFLYVWYRGKRISRQDFAKLKGSNV